MVNDELGRQSGYLFFYGLELFPSLRLGQTKFGEFTPKHINCSLVLFLIEIHLYNVLSAALVLEVGER